MGEEEEEERQQLKKWSALVGLDWPEKGNRNFLLTSAEVAELTRADSLTSGRVSSCGYYRTPQSVDIFVFAIELNHTKWKIYRRYSHFELLRIHLLKFQSELPPLPLKHLQLLRGFQGKQRLHQLHRWMQDLFLNEQQQQREEYWELLASFLLAEANCPPPVYMGEKYEQLLKSFPINLEELNQIPVPSFLQTMAEVHLLVPSCFPSKISCSLFEEKQIPLLGLVLQPHHQQHLNHIGARVVQKKCQAHAAKIANLDYLEIGSILAMVNGKNVLSEQFENILFFLRSLAASGTPINLRFYKRKPIYSYLFSTTAAPSTSNQHEVALEQHQEEQENKIVVHDNNQNHRKPSYVDEDMFTTDKLKKNGKKRSSSSFSMILSDLFHLKQSQEDQVEDEENPEDDSVEYMKSWEETQDYEEIETTGYFTYIPTPSPLSSKKGIWSTSYGPLGLEFKIQHNKFVLAATATKFHSNLDYSDCDLKLCEGLELYSVNDIKLDDADNALQILCDAARPTLLVFHKYNDKLKKTENQADNQQEDQLESEEVFHDALERSQSQARIIEAQADLCKNLNEALIENATLRSDLVVAQETNRLLREERGVLNEELADKSMMIQLLTEEKELLVKTNSSDSNFEQMREKHESELMELSMEHAQEQEFNSQQIALWRHQVEMLTLELNKFKHQSPLTTSNNKKVYEEAIRKEMQLSAESEVRKQDRVKCATEEEEEFIAKNQVCEKENFEKENCETQPTTSLWSSMFGG